MDFDADTTATVDTPQSANGDNSTLLRTYDPNAFSHGRLKCLQACPRRFYIEYERGMERIHQNAKGLRMGKAFSMALEHNNPRLVFDSMYSALIDQAGSKEQIEEMQIESAIVQWYAGKYIEIYGPARMREIEYSFPIGDTGFSYRSAADGLDLHNGKVVCIEDKFMGRWDETREQNVYLDPQPTSEIYGVNSLGFHFDGMPNIKVDTCLYRVTLKPRIIRKKGRGKNAVPESWQDYVSRAIETVEADLSEYFHEIIITKTDAEIEIGRAHV